MTETEKNELRVKVAELRGYRLHSDSQFAFDVWHDPSGKVVESLPDYPNDLNACAEFEKGLTPEQRVRYTDNLLTICTGFESWADMGGHEDFWDFHNATATQRCLAFVKLMEKKR